MRRRFAFTPLKQRLPDTLARVARVNKERTNLRRFERGIQIGRVSRDVLVAAEECSPPAPTTTTNQLARTLDDEICAVINQRSIYAKHGFDCRFNLRVV